MHFACVQLFMLLHNLLVLACCHIATNPCVAVFASHRNPHFWYCQPYESVAVVYPRYVLCLQGRWHWQNYCELYLFSRE